MRRMYLFIRATCFFTLLWGVVINAYTQTFCGFDQVKSTINTRFPSIAQNIADNELQIKQIIARERKQPSFGKREMMIYTIPVVVHILHTGGETGTVYNPDTTQIIEAIDYLNDVFSGQNSSLTPAGPDAAGDIGIRFVLAKRDPNCNPTNGIHRVDMSSNTNYISNGAIYDDLSADIAMKSPIIWDKSRYYNIYVVNKINSRNGEPSDVAAYAYLPVSSVADGTVILASQMKAGSKSLVHEMGHAFNLYHPFEGSNHSTECPVGDNDMVDDTDPISYNTDEYGTTNFLCREGANACNNNLPYNIRTESNFMNYTACYTLFTPGQKERMRASLLLHDRKTLLTSTASLPTYQNPACSPKINFESDLAELERVSYGAIGCRKYKDYLVNLNISSKPSTNVTVELQVDPTSDAVENIDYVFPEGKKVTFPAGSYNVRSFKVRVFSDENYNNLRTLKLGFSVGPGGDPYKGTACIIMNVRILPRDDRPVPPGSIVRLQVGKQDKDITDISIFNGSVQNQKTQILYRAAELKKAGLRAGNITGFSFFLLKQTTRPFKNIHIKMGHTKYAELVNNGNINIVNNAVSVASLISFKTAYGWNNFRFNTPFKWNGTDNVIIEMCIDNGVGTDFGIDEVYAYADTGATERGNTVFSIDEGCNTALSSISYYSRGIRPVIQFDHVKAGNPVEDTLSVSSSEYVGPYAEVYFYDKTSRNKIIAKIKNLSNWDYGCTTIEIDRFGNNAAPFWNNTHAQFLAEKTFTVRPQKNNPQGKYELTLYYTGSEKSGYENSTGIEWKNIKVVKAGVAIRTISPANPETDKVEIAPVSSFASYGSGYTVTARFNTGLSSYGVGYANTMALPVEWGDIQALAVNQDVMLKWETLTEFNNDYFEIEKSNDAIHFETIAKVPGKLNSNEISYYQYIHINPSGFNKIYYRVVQVDKDGSRSYSKIVYVHLNATVSKPSIYPVPAHNNITIHFGSGIMHPVIEIYSIDMKLLGVHKKNGRSASETINIQHLGAGSYIAVVFYGGKKYPLRFVKL